MALTVIGSLILIAVTWYFINACDELVTVLP